MAVGFIEWCDLVLDKLIETAASSLQARRMGVDEFELARAIFGEDAVAQPGFSESKARLGMRDALAELRDVYLVEEANGRIVKATREADDHAADRTALWHALCQTALKPEQEELLRVVNRLSPQSSKRYAEVNWIEGERLLDDLNWPDGTDALLAVGQELHELHLVDRQARISSHVKLAARYRGLVWEHKRGFTLESKFIDELIVDWETTSVDFKRQQETKTADQKAELVKDVIALANTQASGQRWLIIGFDDKTHAYHGPPQTKLDQEHVEQLMSVYTAPVVKVRYEVVDYRSGKVGKLEVVREPRNLPYRVAKSVGNKKRIKKDDVFVRHGSLVEKPSEDELKAIEDEGERARGQ